jgi:hypothetical protein
LVLLTEFRSSAGGKTIKAWSNLEWWIGSLVWPPFLQNQNFHRTGKVTKLPACGHGPKNKTSGISYFIYNSIHYEESIWSPYPPIILHFTLGKQQFPHAHTTWDSHRFILRDGSMTGRRLWTGIYVCVIFSGEF